MNNHPTAYSPIRTSRFSVVVFIVLVIACPLLRWQYHQSWFRMGYDFQLDLTLLYFFAIDCVLILSAIILAVSIIWRLIRHRRITFAETAIFVGTVGILLTFWCQDVRRQDRLFLQGVQRKLDDLNFTKKAVTAYLASERSKTPELPLELQATQGRPHFFSHDCISIALGGGFYHWGILIPTKPTFSIDDFDDSFLLQESSANGYYLYVILEQ